MASLPTKGVLGPLRQLGPQLERYRDATVRLDPAGGAAKIVWHDDGWTAPAEWLARVESRPTTLPKITPALPSTSWPSSKPAWVTQATGTEPISQTPTVLLRGDSVSVSKAEAHLLKGRPVVDQKIYASLVRMVSLETGCAQTRSALTQLLQADPSPLWCSKSAEGLRLIDELHDLAMVVRTRSASDALDQPRLLREVILEIQDARRMRQKATPSCLITAIFQHGVLHHQREAEYVRQVRDLAARGWTRLGSGVLLEASENWLNDSVDHRSQTLRLLASAYYTRTHLENPDRVVAESLVYKHAGEKELFEWFLGRPVETRSAPRPPGSADDLLNLAPPYVASIEYSSPETRHAVVVLSVAAGVVQFLNPWGRMESAPRSEFSRHLDQVWLPSARDLGAVTKAHGLEHSRRAGGIVDWDELPSLERADALLAYGPFFVHGLAKKLGVTETELDAVNDFRVALEVVQRAENSPSASQLLRSELVAKPRVAYRQWASTVDSKTTRVRSLVEWQQAASTLDALRDRPPPTAHEVRAFVDKLMSDGLSLWRPILRAGLQGAMVPLFDASPHSTSGRSRSREFEATYLKLIQWLEQDRLLGAACRGELPRMELYETPRRRRGFDPNDPSDVEDFDRHVARVSSDLVDLITRHAANGSS